MNIPPPESADASRAMLVVSAKHEIETMSTFFHSISNACFAKCVGKAHLTPDLTVAETTCLDRCTIKYMASQHEASRIIQQLSEQKQQQAAAQQAAMSAITGK